jgi:hypothetical protein
MRNVHFLTMIDGIIPVRILVAAIAVSGMSLAQEPLAGPQQAPAAAQQSTPDNPAEITPPPDNQPTSNAKSGPKSAQWKGLTVKEKLSYDWRHLFDVDNMVFAVVGASFDQLRDRPGQWGEGWGPFAGRYGSHVGYYIVQRSIFFPVQAIDHEDTRYFRSERTSYKGRLGDAFLHTIWRHNDSGGMMPAYSEFLGDYGAAAVSRMWWPKQYHTGSAIFIAGSDTILVDAGINVFHEFAPDIKRWLHFSH